MTNSYEPGTRRIERVLELRASIDRVFALLSSPEGLASWFAHRTTEVAGGFRVEWDMPDRLLSLDCSVVECVPPDRFAFRWESEYKGHDTIATFELSQRGETCELRFVESGFGEGPEWDRAFQEQSSGWDDVFQRLAAVASVSEGSEGVSTFPGA